MKGSNPGGDTKSSHDGLYRFVLNFKIKRFCRRYQNIIFILDRYTGNFLPLIYWIKYNVQKWKSEYHDYIYVGIPCTLRKCASISVHIIKNSKLCVVSELWKYAVGQVFSWHPHKIVYEYQNTTMLCIHGLQSYVKVPERFNIFQTIIRKNKIIWVRKLMRIHHKIHPLNEIFVVLQTRDGLR